MKFKEGMLKAIPFICIFIITALSISRLIYDGYSIIKLISSTVLLLIMIGVAAFYFMQYYEKKLDIKNYQIMLWVFVFIGYIPSLMLSSINPYLLPILLTTALITSMIHVRLGFILNFVMITLLLITTGISVEIYLMYVVVGSFISLTIPFAKNRQQVLYVTASNMFFFMLLNIITWLIAFGDLVEYNYLSLVYSAFNGVLVVIFAVGTEPIWEMMFSITSNARLIELSNSNEPLLKKLILEAPGTYHHSIIVANLAEKAAIEINANYHLARVGALYHDIGKINHPEYFTENQKGKNIHDELSPDASAVYIINHVKDGVVLAKEYKLPKDIQDIIREHQGDSIVSYFYQKAMKHSDGFEISDDDFRYKGPKPQSRESAVIMLADCVEAATKSLSEGNRNLTSISDKIDNVISTVISKQQLNECPLSFSEIPIIKEAFLTVYNGMYHERIKYERS